MDTGRCWSGEKFGVMASLFLSLALLGCGDVPQDFVIVDRNTVTGIVAENPRIISIIDEDPANSGGTLVDSFFESMYTHMKGIRIGRIIICEIPVRVEGEGLFLLQSTPHNPLHNQHLKECSSLRKGAQFAVEIEKRYFWNGAGPFQKTVRLLREESNL